MKSTSKSTYQVCSINKALITELTGEINLFEVEALNLNLSQNDNHLSEGDASPPTIRKIRKIESMNLIPNIMHLSLSHNAISKIEGLSGLSKLISLNLAENDIKVFENLEKLTNLQKLNLSGNLITHIPGSISHLKRLSEFRIARNSLSDLNDLAHLHSLPKLTAVEAQDNPLCEGETLYAQYWDFVIYQVDNLELLDKEPVSREDHMLARRSLVASGRLRMRGALSSNDNARDVSENEISAAHASVQLVAPSSQSRNDDEHTYRLQRSSVAPAEAASTRTVSATNATTQFTPVRSGLASSTPMSPAAIKHLNDTEQRAEVLAGKLLASEHQKEALAMEVAALRATKEQDQSQQVQLLDTLRSELQQAQLQLREAQDQEEISRKQLVARTAELEEARVEAQRVSLLNDGLRREMEAALAKAEQAVEAERVLQLRLSTQEAQNAQILLSSSLTAVGGDLAAYDTRNEVAASRVKISQLELELERIRSEKESVTQKWLSSNEALTESRDENARLRDRVGSVEHENRTLQQRTVELQRTETTFTNQLQQLTESRAALDNERIHYKALFEQRDADMTAYLKAAKQTKVATPSRYGTETTTTNLKQHILQLHNVHGAKFADERYVGGANSMYFEVASTDSEDAVDTAAPDHGANLLSDLQNRQQQKKMSSYAPPERFSLSGLERAAAEIMAHMLLEEIRNCGGSERVLRDFDDGRGLKEACARAAIRLVSASVNIAREDGLDGENAAEEAASGRLGLSTPLSSEAQPLNRALYRSGGHVKKTSFADIPPSPFHLLGNRAYLSRLVTETQAGIAAIEDSNSIKKEIEQLKRMAREEEIRGESLQQDIAAKQDVLASLKTHCDEAKSKANETLDELAVLSKRLQGARDDIANTESESARVRRELEICTAHLKEARGMSKVETSHLTAMQAKVLGLRDTQTALEQQILLVREEKLRDEDTLRKAKAEAGEQLRLLQTDLYRIQNEFKAKQRGLEEMEKQRHSLEEERDLKLREAETRLQGIARQHEEEFRKLNAAKEDLALANLEKGQLSSRRRELETELSRKQEELAALSSRCGSQDLEAKSRLLDFDRRVAEFEKNIRLLKSNVAVLHDEQTALHHAIEEKRRVHADLEKVIDSRRRTAEEELSHTQSQQQSALRDCNQKKIELNLCQGQFEALTSEVHILERRLDSLRRNVHEQELQLDTRKDAVKAVETEREQRRLQSDKLQKEYSARQHELEMIRTEVSAQNRLLDELQRSVSGLRVEETAVRESHASLSRTVATARSDLQNVQMELDRTSKQVIRTRLELDEAQRAKAVVTGELNRLREEVKCAQVRNSEEGLRKVEMEARLQKCTEDVHRTERECLALEQQVDSAARIVKDLQQREKELVAVQSNLRTESTMRKEAIAAEKTTLDRLTEQKYELENRVRAAESENIRLQRELSKSMTDVDQRKAEHQHLVQKREDLVSEISDLRQTIRLDAERAERVQRTNQAEESHGRSLRDERKSAEREAAEAQSRKEEYEQQVKQKVRELKLVEEALTATRHEKSAEEKLLRDQMEQKILSLAGLDQVAKTKQAELLSISEAHKRLDSSTTSSARRHFSEKYDSSHSALAPTSHSSGLFPATLQRSSANTYVDALYKTMATAAPPPPAPSSPKRDVNTSIAGVLPDYLRPPPASLQSIKSSSGAAAAKSSSGSSMQEVELSALQRELESLRVLSTESLSASAGFK